MFARFDENPAMTLQDIKKNVTDGRADARTHTRTDNVKTVYSPQTKFAGGGGIKHLCTNHKVIGEPMAKTYNASLKLRTFVKYCL